MGRKRNDEPPSISLADIKHDASGLWFDDGDIVVVGQTDKIGFKVSYSRSRSLRDQCHLLSSPLGVAAGPQESSISGVSSFCRHDFEDILKDTCISWNSYTLHGGSNECFERDLVGVVQWAKVRLPPRLHERQILTVSLLVVKIFLGRLCTHFPRIEHFTHREFRPQARPLIQGSRPLSEAMLS